MASTVVCPALTTVNTTHVTYNMGIALDVSLDGQEQCVTRVSLFTAYIILAKMGDYYVPTNIYGKKKVKAHDLQII